MPPKIIIIRPPKPVTEEEIKRNQKYIDELNDILSDIAHNSVYRESE